MVVVGAKAELGIGEKGEQFMKKDKIKYSDEPIEAKVVNDFLPPPEELNFKEEKVKVTLLLSKKSLNFFKKQAAKEHVPYQSMIRVLLDKYSDHYSN